MKLTIKLSKPTAQKRKSFLSALTRRHPRPHQSRFTLDRSRSHSDTSNTTSRGPFELDAKQAHYYCGVLARTSDHRQLLGVTDYIGGSHSYLYDVVMGHFDPGAHFLWGGELMFVGPAESRGIATLVRANETSGWFEFLKDKSHVENNLRNLTRFIAGARELPFDVSPDVDWLSFDNKAPHLLPELNEFLSEHGGNLRHSLNGKLATLNMLFDTFFRGHKTAQNVKQKFLDQLKEHHEFMIFVINWIQKYEPDHARDIGTLPSLDQIISYADEDFRVLIEEYNQTLRRLFHYINRSTYQPGQDWNNVIRGDYHFYEIDQKSWWERLVL